jgi:hypothetical protein
VPGEHVEVAAGVQQRDPDRMAMLAIRHSAIG